MKKKYPSSIYLDADVHSMVGNARRQGWKFGFLCNEALRIHLKKLGFHLKKASK